MKKNKVTIKNDVSLYSLDPIIGPKKLIYYCKDSNKKFEDFGETTVKIVFDYDVNLYVLKHRLGDILTANELRAVADELDRLNRLNKRVKK